MRLDHLLSKEEGVGVRLREGDFPVSCSVMRVLEEREGMRACSCETVKLLAAMRSGETPVPIPNTTVKTGTADGTMLETAWESRWLPDY